MKRTDAELLVLYAEAASCWMTIEQYLAAQQWGALFARAGAPRRKRRQKRT